MKTTLSLLSLFLLSFFAPAQTIDSLSVSRYGMSAATVGNKVYFAGSGANSGSNVVDVYDPSTGNWSVMHTTLRHGSQFCKVIGGKIYFIEGVSFSLDSARMIDVYDTGTGQWSLDSIPAYTHIEGLYHDVEVHDSELVFLGKGFSSSYASCIFGLNTVTHTWWLDTIPDSLAGSSFSICGDEAVWLTGSMLFPAQYMVRYNLVTGVLTTDSFPQLTDEPAVFSAEDKTFFVGGHQPMSAWSSTLFMIYDHTNNTFLQPTTYMARPEQILRYGNKILFAGGSAYTGISSFYTGNLLLYDLSADTFSLRFSPVHRGGISVAAACGKFYIAGGYTMAGVDYDHIDILDTLNAVMGQAHLSSPRSRTAAATVNQELLVAGGAVNYYTPKDTVDIFSCLGLSVPQETTAAFSLFPNPATDQLTITSTSDFETFTLYDAQGRQVITGTLNSTQTQINIATCTPGLYFLVLHSPTAKTSSQHLLITR